MATNASVGVDLPSRATFLRDDGAVRPAERIKSLRRPGRTLSEEWSQRRAVGLGSHHGRHLGVQRYAHD